MSRFVGESLSAVFSGVRSVKDRNPSLTETVKAIVKLFLFLVIARPIGVLCLTHHRNGASRTSCPAPPWPFLRELSDLQNFPQQKK